MRTAFGDEDIDKVCCASNKVLKNEISVSNLTCQENEGKLDPRTILSNMDLSAFFHIYISGPLKKYLKNYERTTEGAHLCDNNKCTPFAFI